MAKRNGAGAMRQKVHFQRRTEKEDEYGNTVEDFQTIFTDAAEFIPLRGGEQVTAARLTGIQPFIVRVHSSTQTRAVGPDWQIVDARSGVVYAITAPPVNTDQKNAYLDIMVTQGKAS
ncbi:head-tail adaptor protein [Pararhizobium sp. O133]|uniref:head-tail adaptor protein n=1 Tax=Pararhizobium sp. O133 TaxID=3449278 RepID=UPI003F689449